MNAVSKMLMTFALGVACLLTLCLGCQGDFRKKSTQTAKRPNIVLILTDDMAFGDARRMPELKSLMMDRGTTFDDAYVTDATCAPSRATILRGQYTHNHKVRVTNTGFQRFHNLGLEDSTVATWLRSGGYRTVLIGKYLNGYGGASTYVPPGWDEWYANSSEAGSYDYKLNENGKVVSYGSAPKDYKTDVLARKAEDYVKRSAGGGRPFFMYLAPSAPHPPAIPAPRYEDAFPDAEAPRPPSFDETDVSDKPEWVRKRGALSPQETSAMDELYRDRLRSLLSVDNMIEGLVDALGDEGELDNTYIFFTSDNGFHLGQHRLPEEKWTPYEEDIRVPLVVRGPDVPAGRVSDHLVLNNDLAPTFAKLAGVSPPSFVDGRSLAPLLGDELPNTTEWRSAFLVESARDGARGKVRSRPAFEAVRTERYVYVKYESGERELYDLAEDPYELNNLYTSAGPDLLGQLQMRLKALRECAGAKCRPAEDG